jgi:hypothetical protein
MRFVQSREAALVRVRDLVAAENREDRSRSDVATGVALGGDQLVLHQTPAVRCPVYQAKRRMELRAIGYCLPRMAERQIYKPAEQPDARLYLILYPGVERAREPYRRALRVGSEQVGTHGAPVRQLADKRR